MLPSGQGNSKRSLTGWRLGRVLGGRGVPWLTAITQRIMALGTGTQHVKALLSLAPFPVCVTRISDSRIIYVNNWLCNQMEASAAELIGRFASDFYGDPRDRQPLIDAVRRDGVVAEREVMLRSQRGRVFWVLGSAKRLVFGGEDAIFVTWTDLTAVKSQQRHIDRLAAQERALSLVLHLAVRAGALEDFLGQTLSSLMAGMTWMAGPFTLAAHIDETEGDGASEGVRIARTVDRFGRQSPQAEEALPASAKRFPVITGDTVLGFLAVSVDPDRLVAEEDIAFFQRVADIISIGVVRRKAEKEIAHLAFRDPLTRLPNRRMMMSRLQHDVSAALRLGLVGAVVHIDLDRFKTLNDALGHSTGDALLVQVAARLMANVREGDMVSRVGGDEVVVWLQGLSHNRAAAATGAYNIAEKLRRALSVPYDLHGHLQHLTSSIGVALFPDHAPDVEAVLKHAEAAMYHSKAEGRNTIRFFEPDMLVSVESRLDIENQLRLALQNGEFAIVYQPLVDERGAAIGAEALLRWHHPVRGQVSPGEFIPVAEETGLIIEIGRWVLEAVVQQVKEWEGASRVHDGYHIAVNFSPRQFHQTDFCAMVTEVVGNSGIDPTKLVLEITEGVLIKDPTNVVAKMEELHRLGIRFYIDDFGTGYSSMSYLKRLPVHGLKIDQSFVRDLGDDPTDAAIVEAIIAMARRFNLMVVAEGVETEAQFAFLRDQGCEAYQGFHFGRPLPPEAFAAAFLLPTKIGQ